MKLFRQQAIDHQHRLHGEVFLVTPLPWRTIVALPIALALVAVVTLAIGTSGRSVVASGLLAQEDGYWRARLFLPATDVKQVHMGQNVQLKLIGEGTAGTGSVAGTVQQIDPVVDGEARLTVLLDPPPPVQPGQDLIFRQGRPVSARILLRRETLWQTLTGTGADE